MTAPAVLTIATVMVVILGVTGVAPRLQLHFLGWPLVARLAADTAMRSTQGELRQPVMIEGNTAP